MSTTMRTAAKKTTAKKTTTTKKTAAKSTKKKAFIFFNCDEGKSNTSMNIYHNTTIYQDTKAARTKLAAKVAEEVKKGLVNVTDGTITAVRKEIVDGDPLKAAEKLQFGAIVTLDLI